MTAKQSDSGAKGEKSNEVASSPQSAGNQSEGAEAATEMGIK